MTELKVIRNNLMISLNDLDKFYESWRSDLSKLEEQNLRYHMNSVFRLILLLDWLLKKEGR